MKRYIRTDNTHADKDTTHIYKYILDGRTQFIELTDEDRNVFEDKYDVQLSYWRD